MALSSPFSLILTAVLIISNSLTHAQIDHSRSLQLMNESLEWPSTKSLSEQFSMFDDGEQEEIGTENDRRSLYWTSSRYYISYGALLANRIPCPARSGRSYYTPNCYKASGPVRPYTRGCSAITRCRI